MILRRLTKAALGAAVMALFAAAPASAAVIVYSFEGLGKFSSRFYSLDYNSSDEISSEEVFDHVPFEATLTIDTQRLGTSGGLVAEWSGGPPSLASSMPVSSSYENWSTSDRGVFFDIMRSTVEDGPDNSLINSSFTSEARLRLLDNELTSAPIFMIDGYSFPDLTDFMVEFSLNTVAFRQMLDFADLFVEDGDITQIFSVGRATMTVVNAVPEPPQWGLLAVALGLFGALGPARRHLSRAAI